MKIIFINWRWGTLNETFNPLEIKETSNLVITSSFADGAGFRTHIVNTLRSKRPDSYLVLTHANPDSVINIPENEITINNEIQSRFKVIEFSGADPIKNEKAYELFNQQSSNVPEIILENFDSVWNYFWREKVLEEQKKKLIDTFLPLAIDQQGLIESSSKGNKNQYLQNVQNDIEANAEEIISAWSDIKKTLALNLQAVEQLFECLAEEYRLSDPGKASMYFPLESKDIPGFTKEELINYIISFNYNDGVKTVSTWLKDVVDLIDEIIKKIK